MIKAQDFVTLWNSSDSGNAVAAALGITPPGARARASRLRRAGYKLKRMTGDQRTPEFMARIRAMRKPEHKFTSWTGHLAGVRRGEIRTMERLLKIGRSSS